MKNQVSIKGLLTPLWTLLITLVITPSLCLAVQKHVYDYAKVYDTETLDKYDGLLHSIEAKHQLKIEAVILPKLSGHSSDQVIRHFATELESRGEPTDKNVLFLVSIQENLVIVLPSEKLGVVYPDSVLLEISGKVKEEMQNQAFNNILKSGLGGIIHYYNKNNDKLDKNDSFDMHGFLKTNIIVLIIGLVVFFVFRFGRKKAKKVG